LSVDAASIAMNAAKGRNTTMFSARSLGFFMIPPTDPLTRVP
jgi:hypothetical protein